jgi:hypothetical protein
MSSIRATYARTAFALLAAALTVATAHGGYRIEMGGVEILVGEGRLRRSIPQLGIIMAFDPARDALWLANSKTRTYWQGTVAEYCTDAKRTQEAMKAQIMGKLSPEQRRFMEQHMKKEQETPAATPEPQKTIKPVRVTVERTDETEIIAGRAAHKVRVLADGKLYEELWLATEPELARAADFGKVADLEKRMRTCASGEMDAQIERYRAQIGPMGRWMLDRGAAGEARERMELLRAVQATPEYAALMSESFPLKTKPYYRGAASDVPAVTAVEQRDLTAADLDPPGGFRRAPADEVMSGRSMMR